MARKAFDPWLVGAVVASVSMGVGAFLWKGTPERLKIYYQTVHYNNLSEEEKKKLSQQQIQTHQYQQYGQPQQPQYGQSQQPQQPQYGQYDQQYPQYGQPQQNKPQFKPHDGYYDQSKNNGEIWIDTDDSKWQKKGNNQ